MSSLTSLKQRLVILTLPTGDVFCDIDTRLDRDRETECGGGGGGEIKGDRGTDRQTDIDKD